MKTGQKWRLDMGDMKILPGPRQRPTKRPLWIIILVSMVSVFLICAYIYPPNGSGACYIFSSKGCKVITDWLPPAPAREYSDAEIASRIVIREILNTHSVSTKTPKIAFLFLTPGSLPFEKLWDKFFEVSFCICLLLSLFIPWSFPRSSCSDYVFNSLAIIFTFIRDVDVFAAYCNLYILYNIYPSDICWTLHDEQYALLNLQFELRL